MFYTIYKNKIVGKIILYGEKEFLLGLEFFKKDVIKKEWVENEKVFEKVIKELDLYFNKELKTFSIPLKLTGTPFQKKVHKELQKIPYAKTISYQELAKRVGNEKSSRAVGNANGKNHIAIIIPCHRVISKNGSIGGFSSGVGIKRKLLKFEGYL